MTKIEVKKLETLDVLKYKLQNRNKRKEVEKTVLDKFSSEDYENKDAYRIDKKKKPSLGMELFKLDKFDISSAFKEDSVEVESKYGKKNLTEDKVKKVMDEISGIRTEKDYQSFVEWFNVFVLEGEYSWNDKSRLYSMIVDMHHNFTKHYNLYLSKTKLSCENVNAVRTKEDFVEYLRTSLDMVNEDMKDCLNHLIDIEDLIRVNSYLQRFLEILVRM